MKKIVAILIAVMLMLSLTACFNIGDLSKDDPNLGIYNGAYVVMAGTKMSMDEVYYGENYIHLGAAGHCKFCLEGDEVKGNWTVEGEEITVTVDGVESVGTLKDGVLVIDFAGTGIELYFAKDGVEITDFNNVDDGTDHGADNTDGGEGSGDGSDEGGDYEMTAHPGYYEIYSLSDYTDTLDRETLAGLGYTDTTYLQWEDDGTGYICVEGEGEYFTYDDEKIYLTGDSAYYYYDEGMLTISAEEIEFVFVLTLEEGLGVVETFPESFATEIEGDWHGWAQVIDAGGRFEDNYGDEFEIIGRFVFDENYGCTPYLAFALGGDDNNFKNITVSYNQYGDIMMLEGEVFDEQILDGSNIYAWDGISYVDLYVDDGEGNYVTVVAAMCHLDSDWDFDKSEFGYPYMPQDAVDFYKGKSFMEIAELFQLDLSEIPEA